MTDIIENWLLNTVRCNIKCTPEILGKACCDGRIFARILVTYNVCSSDYLKLINETVSKKVALGNLKKLCVWFKLLGINITDELLNEIVNENGSASLMLLYELFVRLENQENMVYMDRKKMQRIISESTDKFQVTPVPDIETIPEIVDEKEYLRELMDSMKGVIESAEKNSLKRFLIDGIKKRAELVKKKIMNDFPPPSKYYDKKLYPHLDVQAKINEFEDIVESPEGKENQNQKYKCEPAEYISYLKMKRRKAEADKKLKIKLGQNSMDDAWKKILKNQEIELKNLLSIKLLKQSEHEKQMTLRLKRMRLKYLKFIDTRNMVVSMAEKQEAVNQFRSSFNEIKEKEKTRIERQRIRELHDRLFKEKLKWKKKMDRIACRRIVEDLVDFAMVTHGYFEQNGMTMPRNKTNELKLLFMKGVRLLPQDLVSKGENDLEPTSITLDDERLKELAEYDFYLYLYRLGPWFLTKKSEEDELLKITGFIIHRLLDLKYDFSLSLGDPADLPRHNYKIFLHHINDTYALEKLKHYLSRFKIVVFDIFDVINHFLNSYKLYVGTDAIKESSKNVSPKSNKSNSVPYPNRPKFKPWSGIVDKISRGIADKGIQFPSDDKLAQEKTLSSELGQCAYEILQTGDLLPDSFLCHLIIEYLKQLKDVEGWVIINYPENITQIAILEYMFTGLEVPYMSKVTQNIRKLIESQLKEAMPDKKHGDDKGDGEIKLSYNSLYENKSEYETQVPEQFSVEELIELKNSDIIPRPYPPPEPLTFESFFTKVIILKRELVRKGIKGGIPKQKITVEEEVGTEEIVTLETFYASQDISSTFSYRYFDTTTLKKLLTFILNISGSKEKEFFKNIEKGGDIVKIDTNKPTKPENKPRSSPKPMKYKRNALDDWVLRTFLETDYPYAEEVDEEVEEEMLIFPGHKDWEYTEFSISEFHISVLATVWESIEYFYTDNLKKCFSLQRTIERRLMPYRNYVRRKAEECLGLSDDRTDVVTNFQLMLNKISDQCRPLDSMKNELHNRVLKLQCELWKITDVKKFYCDQVYEMMYNQNWISGHLTSILQIYCLILQIETDRFADTMQLIEDYYSVCLLGKTQEDRLMKIVLPKVRLKAKKKDHVRKYSRHHLSTSGSKKHKSIEHKQSKMHMDFDGSKTVFYYSDYETLENPSLSLLKALISRLTKNIQQMKTLCESRSNSITDKLKESSRQATRPDSSKRPSRLNSPLMKLLMKDSNMTPEVYNSIINKVSLEWTFAMDNECKRALYRINMIEKRASSDLKEDNDVIENVFKEFKQGIVNLYHNQILNVDKVCDLMRAAVEEEVKIQPLVVLGNDSLEIDTSKILYRDPPPPPPSSLVEAAIGFRFTVSQLTNLFYKLVYVAPYGIIEQTFVLILEDMASIGHETGHSYLPPYWSDLSSDRIKEIVHRLYGERVILDWRHFIIYGLDLGYPTLEDILYMRNNFKHIDRNLTETVTYEQFSCVYLWFENKETLSLRQDLYIAKAKELLFKLYQIGDNLMNYTELLLAFCRDHDPREGFVKALALVEGCATIIWKQDLFRETFQIEKENEKYNVACGVLTILMNGVYQVVDSVIITEVVNEEDCISISSNVSVGSKKSSKMNVKKKKRSQANTESYEVSHSVEDFAGYGPQEPEETSLDVVENGKPEVLWKSDVYFSTVFSLMMLDIYHFALSSDQIYEPFRLEENLRRIFKEKGKDGTIKLFYLLSDVYVQKIFASYRSFHGFSLPQMLMKLAKEECSSYGEQN